jgi:hypothetical protein
MGGSITVGCDFEGLSFRYAIVPLAMTTDQSGEVRWQEPPEARSHGGMPRKASVMRRAMNRPGHPASLGSFGSRWGPGSRQFLTLAVLTLPKPAPWPRSQPGRHQVGGARRRPVQPPRAGSPRPPSPRPGTRLGRPWLRLRPRQRRHCFGPPTLWPSREPAANDRPNTAAVALGERAPVIDHVLGVGGRCVGFCVA